MTQAVRGRIIADGAADNRPALAARADITDHALRSARAALCVVFSLLVFLACTSIHSVERASTADAPLATSEHDNDVFAAPTSGCAQYRQNSETLPVCELDALAFEEVEEDGELDAQSPGALAARVVRTLLCSEHALGGAPAAYPARFLVSCALPRGPPSLRV